MIIIIINFYRIYRTEVTPWYQCQTGAAYDANHVYTKAQFEEYMTAIRNGRPMYYGNTDLFIYE